jgi:predicted nucleic acid-binding protein
MPWPVLHELLEGMKQNLVVTPVSVSTHELGLRLAERHHFRVYDAQLIAAALEAGCTTFWSEDLHNGQLIDGQLTVRNPFA